MGFLEVWNADGVGVGFLAFARPRILKESLHAQVEWKRFVLWVSSFPRPQLLKVATQGAPFATDILNRVLPNASNSTAQAALASVSSRRGGTWGGKVKFILPQAFAIVMWRGDDRREEDRVRRQACEGPSE